MSKKLATTDYVDKSTNSAVGKMKYYSINSLTELDNIIKQNPEKSLIACPHSDISISGVTIKAWSHIFLPFPTTTDSIGFAVFPKATSFIIVGRAENTWYAKKNV